jgi:hypothetical protein
MVQITVLWKLTQTKWIFTCVARTIDHDHRDGRGEAAHKTFISLLSPHLEEKLISDSSMFDDDDEILTAETIILANKAHFHFCAGTRIRRHRQRHILSGLVSGLPRA